MKPLIDVINSHTGILIFVSYGQPSTADMHIEMKIHVI